MSKPEPGLDDQTLGNYRTKMLCPQIETISSKVAGSPLPKHESGAFGIASSLIYFSIFSSLPQNMVPVIG